MGKRVFKAAIAATIITTAIMSHSVQSHAAELDKEVLSCVKINEDTARLACFDKMAKSVLTVQQYEKVEQERKAALLAKKEEERRKAIEAFGEGNLAQSPIKEVREEKQRKDEEIKEADQVTLTVKKYKYLKSKKFVMYMTNGQIWTQKESKRIPLPKGQFDVQIKTGVFGSYNMIVPTRKALIRVKRVK